MAYSRGEKICEIKIYTSLWGPIGYTAPSRPLGSHLYTSNHRIRSAFDSTWSVFSCLVMYILWVLPNTKYNRFGLQRNPKIEDYIQSLKNNLSLEKSEATTIHTVHALLRPT